MIPSLLTRLSSPLRREKLTALGGRSLAVLIGKNALLLLTLALILTIVLVTWINSGEKSGRLVFSSVEKSGQDRTRMIQPRYHGVDDRNRPYTVTADAAEQLPDESIMLENVTADMMMEEAAWLALVADRGMLNPERDRIELTGNIQMFYEGGYEFRSDYAMVELDHGRVWGDQPVVAQSSHGTIRAKSFEVTESGDIITFRDAVNVTLYKD